MKILMVASEVAPFVRTGGLADVVTALSKVLDKQGHDLIAHPPSIWEKICFFVKGKPPRCAHIY